MVNHILAIADFLNGNNLSFILNLNFKRMFKTHLL